MIVWDNCEDYIPLTHPKYTTGGCTGCENCRIYSDGKIICLKHYWIGLTTLPVTNKDEFSCENFISEMGLEGCYPCIHFNGDDEVCELKHKTTRLWVKLF